MENKKTTKPLGIDYSNKILEVKNLKTYFKVGTGKNKIKIKAVDDISIDIYKRDVFGLVGESGCGKTTAARTIIRLYRPTCGQVKFEGQIIGSGHNEFYRLMKYKRINYKIDKLKLNSRKKAIYDINQKYKKLFDDLKQEQAVLLEEYEKQKELANLPIEEHKKLLFDAKNDNNLVKERAFYEFNINRENIYNQTINEEQLEYEGIKKSLAKNFKIKLGSLDDSVGLSKEVREEQKVLLKHAYEKELIELENEYKDIITDKTDNLMSKEEYKAKLKVLQEEYKKRTIEIREEHKKYLDGLTTPKYEEIKEKLVKLKEGFKINKQAIKVRKNELKAKRSEELKLVEKHAVIDREGLAKLKLEHKCFMKEQREGIKKSREDHYAKPAISQTRKMQMIFQDPISSLNPRMTVGEIVAEGLVINGEKDKEVLKKKVIEALNLVGLAPEYISRYPHEFSGGQRQRIGIARALIMDPSFIIADEPISALDVSIRAQVLNLLTELKEKLDLSILFIAHDLSVVKFFCDRIGVMFAGKIVELAPTAEIFKNPLHPYTKSLLSAVPQPDPDSEKLRKRIIYSPTMHDYSKDKPELREVYTGHFVYCNQAEFAAIKKELGDANA